MAEFSLEKIVKHIKHRAFDKINKKNTLYVLGSIVFFCLFYFLILAAPANFPTGNIVKIELGNNLREVSFLLKQKQIIKSRSAFETLVIIYGGEKHLVSGDYLFENKLPVYEVARRISRGNYHLASISVTIPEGFNVGQIGETFASKLTNFNQESFLLKAKNLEGYLFPDTYLFLITADEQDVIQSMNENFNKKMKLIRPFILAGERNEKEIITMASILEREGKGESDWEFISGILWKRINQSLPLQVDAAPGTYKAKGLPENPIANPGLKTIEAALRPQSSPYLYYLHDKDGLIHYAKNFAEHKRNKLKYLK